MNEGSYGSDCSPGRRWWYFEAISVRISEIDDTAVQAKKNETLLAGRWNAHSGLRKNTEIRAAIDEEQVSPVSRDRTLNQTVGMMHDESTSTNERRGSQRFKISAPLTVIAGEHEIPAYTRDLSNRGVYFYLTLSDSALIEKDFEFTIEMPSEITLSANCRIRCSGKLVRKEVTSRNLTGAGVAAEILNYAILREDSARR